MLSTENVEKEEERTTPTKDKNKEREIPPQTGLETDEPVMKGSPHPESPPAAQQELPVTEAVQDTVAEGDQAKQELTRILFDALLR